jgi:hypothetical protein
VATTAVSKAKYTKLEKAKASASKRAYRYKEQIDRSNSLMGQLPVQAGALAAGVLQSMVADENGDLAGLPADLTMGLGFVGIGIVTGSPFLMKAAQGPLAHYTYELGSQLMEG